MIASGNGGLCGLHAQLRAERDCNIGIEQYVYTTLETGIRVQEKTQEEKNATKENVPQKTQQEDPNVIFFLRNIRYDRAVFKTMGTFTCILYLFSVFVTQKNVQIPGNRIKPGLQEAGV